MGTENVRITAIQRYLRHEGGDSWSGEKSFLYGRSVANQGIEAWWEKPQEGASDWWITHFKDLRDRGLYCDAVLCMLNVYCFVIWQLSVRNSKEWLDCGTCMGFDPRQGTTVLPMVNLVSCTIILKCQKL